MEKARRSETAPKGWPAALVMFHLGMWRERMRTSLTELAEGRTPSPPPPIERQDELNDAELAGGIGIPLSDAAARCEHLLAELMDVYERLGEQPFQWYGAKTTTEAVLRGSYIHTRAHMAEYYKENGDEDAAWRLLEDAVTDLRSAQAPGLVMGAALYNLAIARVDQDRRDEAIELLREAIPMRPDIKTAAAADSDFGDLRDDPRFQDLVQT